MSKINTLKQIGLYPSKNHKIWFSSILKSKKTIIYLAYAKLTKKKIGYVRFDQHNQNWIISIANIKNYQQKGFGTKILKICINKLFKRSLKMKEI